MIAKTPVAPYYAVIFTSIGTEVRDGYQNTSEAEHLMAQDKGRKEWYQNYKTRIFLVKLDYEFKKSV